MPLVLDGTTGFNLPAGSEIGIGTATPAGNLNVISRKPTFQ